MKRELELLGIALIIIEGNYKPVDLARKFCVQRTNHGWTMGN